MKQIQLHKCMSFLVCFGLGALLFGCGSSDEHTAAAPSFESVGLEGRIIYRLAFVGDELQAATDRGLYRRSAADQQWYLLGGLTARIVDWAELGAGHWLLSVADGDDYETVSRYELYESLDDGASWTKLTVAFEDASNPSEEQEPILRMAVLHNEVYATGWGVVAKSADAGRSWEKVAGEWQSFATGLRAISIAPDEAFLWYGGQGGLENLVLGKVDLIDGQEADLGPMMDLLPYPSTVKAIRFDSADEQRVFVTAEGGIVQSHDAGMTWLPFLPNDDYRFYFDLLMDEQESGRYYTAGWSKIIDSPQALILDVSSDNGESWQQYRHPSNTLYGGVYSMTSRIEAGERVIYVGLFKGGVIRISDIPYSEVPYQATGW